MKQFCFAALVVHLFGSLLLSCTTARGTLNEQVVRVERAVAASKAADEQPSQDDDGTPDAEPEDDEEDEIGLRVVTKPSGARVYLNHRYVGESPLSVASIEPGRHRITVRKEGYREITVWIDYDAGLYLYETELEQITGFLLVKTIPRDAQVLLGGTQTTTSFHELPVGTYTLTVRAFGYEERQEVVTVYEKALREVTVRLKEAEFHLSNVSVGRPRLNPGNPGLLGTCRFSFEVTSPGTGKAIIADGSGREVFTTEFVRFETWNQTFLWRGRGDTGAPLPGGEYTVTIVARDEKTEAEHTRAASVTIDESLRIRYRNVWCGSAGLLYAYTVDRLPVGSFQVASFSMGHRVKETYRIPTGLSFRLGLSEIAELDVLAGIIIENTGLVPLYGSVSSRFQMFGSTAGEGLSGAIAAKIAYQSDTPTDLLASFTGISIGAPLQLSVGVLNILYAPELILSPRNIIYDPSSIGANDTGVYLRAYQRAGILVDMGSFTTGVSVSLHSFPLTERLSLYEPPLQAAWEMNLIIPETQLFLGFGVSGEFVSPDNYYLLVGGGMGFLY